MGNLLRDRRTPSEWAASGQVIEFSEKIGEFEGLKRIIEGDLDALDADKLPPDWRDKVVAGQLSFSFADAHNGLPVLAGKVSATVDAVCQRCLKAFELPIEAELRFLFGEDGLSPTEDAGYEVWQLDEDNLRPLDLVEEALIMAMPLAAMHVDSESCGEPEEQEQDSGDRIRPFAGLRSHMEDDNGIE